MLVSVDRDLTALGLSNSGRRSGGLSLFWFSALAALARLDPVHQDHPRQQFRPT
jgi:hypothetical protein